jgi:glutamate 5-kinase
MSNSLTTLPIAQREEILKNPSGTGRFFSPNSYRLVADSGTSLFAMKCYIYQQDAVQGVTMRKELEQARRVVIKLGTYVLTSPEGGLASSRLEDLVAQCAWLANEAGKKVILVSSGAVGLGKGALEMDRLVSLADKQACAAVGQSLLMNEYQRQFSRHGMTTGQLLVTADDFADRRRYLSLRDTFERLLALDVVPIVNENDSVSTFELKEDERTHSFGDNDLLSALVASKLEADVLLILTNVEGVFDSNPDKNPDARLIDRLDDFEQLRRLNLKGQSAYGRGGVTSKVEAARLASYGGVNTIVASGLKPAAILECTGTLVPSRVRLSERKRWIGLSSGFGGVIEVNPGAADALTQQNASLLPSGIVAVRGSFSANEVVSIETEQGREIGRGIVGFSSEDVARIQGCHTRDIAERLGEGGPEEVIHRDHLVIFSEA